MNKQIEKTFFLGRMLVLSIAIMVVAGSCALERTGGDNRCGLVKPGQHEEVMERQITVKIDYLLFLPQQYEPEGKPWPLIIFLHGAGERGDDLQKVKVHGLPKMVENRKDFPFIVVSPQCLEGKWWLHKTETLKALLDEIMAKYNVDRSRVYLTGLSMGGHGTWHLALAYPEYFAALAPICGEGEPYLAARLKQVPVWAFHGARDTVVPLARSQEMVNAVKTAGGDARLTVYPEAGHDCWTATYNNEKLYEWFLEHRREN